MTRIIIVLAIVLISCSYSNAKVSTIGHSSNAKAGCCEATVDKFTCTKCLSDCNDELNCPRCISDGATNHCYCDKCTIFPEESINRFSSQLQLPNLSEEWYSKYPQYSNFLKNLSTQELKELGEISDKLFSSLKKKSLMEYRNNSREYLLKFESLSEQNKNIANTNFNRIMN